jgi:hypothetical protein
MMETTKRYNVMLHGVKVEQLWWNTRGFVGNLPTPDGVSIYVPEGSLASFRREVAKLNREFAAAEKSKGAKQGQTNPLLPAHILKETMRIELDGKRLGSGCDGLEIGITGFEANPTDAENKPSKVSIEVYQGQLRVHVLDGHFQNPVTTLTAPSPAR